MINNDNENPTNTVMNNQSKSQTSDPTNGIMSSTNNLNNTNNGEPPVQPKTNDLNQNESHDQQSIDLSPHEQQQQDEETEQNDDDEFIRITAAHQMLTEAQAYDEQQNYPAALHLYRICVDLLLEELMFTEGTEQSRVYLREKCTAIMDRIDLLKKMLDPIPSQPATTTNEKTTNPPTEQLNSLHLS